MSPPQSPQVLCAGVVVSSVLVVCVLLGDSGVAALRGLTVVGLCCAFELRVLVGVVFPAPAV